MWNENSKWERNSIATSSEEIISENTASSRCDLLEVIDELEVNEGSLIDVK